MQPYLTIAALWRSYSLNSVTWNLDPVTMMDQQYFFQLSITFKLEEIYSVPIYLLPLSFLVFDFSSLEMLSEYTGRVTAVHYIAITLCSRCLPEITRINDWYFWWKHSQASWLVLSFMRVVDAAFTQAVFLQTHDLLLVDFFKRLVSNLPQNICFDLIL